MEGRQHRGRSPSAGQHSNPNIRHSPSPHHFQDQTSSGDLNNPASGSAFTSQSYNADLSPPVGAGIQYTLPPSYLEGSSQAQQYQHVLPSSDFSDSSFGQSSQQHDLGSHVQHEQSQMNSQQSDPQFEADMLNVNSNFGDFPQQQDFTSKQEQFHNSFILDPQLQTGMQQQEQSINPADIMSNMSSPQNIPTPPNLMPPNAQSSEPTSPFPTSNQQWSPHHSRHASLDPSAAYTNGQQPDWSGMLQGSQFQGHRRAPSEHSDVSSSVAPSPYLAQEESFDAYDQNPSPNLIPQSDQQLYKDGLGIETFSLSDPQQQGNSPRHSPFPSPRISPQPGLGMAQENTFMPLPEIPNPFHGASGGEMYHQTEAFPQFPPDQRLGSNDYGQADHFPPPEINVEYVPTVRQSGFEPPRFENDLDALSPPDRGRRGRIRAKSDTSISRPVTPNSNHSTLGSTDSSIDQRNRSLSPYDGSHFSPHISRESSPAPRSSSQRRSSTNSIPNRDYILELADPSRPQAPGTERMRVQKHPATFQCTLCPKKFTRAYNLRSHLRTHTDERPFVCTVCTKAFARQHDRKRHEGLHSGEKKFVCRGELGTGGSWGCGRRFARADALGRHFRSEAGRICIKPLLDEEAMERQRNLDEQMMNQQMHAPGGIAPPPPPASVNVNGMTQNGFALPAALLLQYPALQGIQWDQMPQGGPGDDDELSGRSSFDASSGGDYYDDDGGSGYVSDNPMHPGFEGGGAWAGGQGWKSDVET